MLLDVEELVDKFINSIRTAKLLLTKSIIIGLEVIKVESNLKEAIRLFRKVIRIRPKTLRLYATF